MNELVWLCILRRMKAEKIFFREVLFIKVISQHLLHLHDITHDIIHCACVWESYFISYSISLALGKMVIGGIQMYLFQLLFINFKTLILPSLRGCLHNTAFNKKLELWLYNHWKWFIKPKTLQLSYQWKADFVKWKIHLFHIHSNNMQKWCSLHKTVNI